jgi:hypothetical protein
MGNAVKSFATTVAKGAIKAGLGVIPVVGGALGDYVTSKFAVGSFDVGAMGIKIPEDAKQKVISTPAQLKQLVKEHPVEAKKAGLTVEMIDEGVQEAKEQSKAIGGSVKLSKKDFVRKMEIPPATEFGKVSKAVGGKVDAPKKEKKPRTAAQIAATKRMLAGLKKHREEKAKSKQ